MEVVREIAEIVGVPEAVVEDELEIEEAEREKQSEQQGSQQKRLQESLRSTGRNALDTENRIMRPGGRSIPRRLLIRSTWYFVGDEGSLERH
jgi:hypothetical protein